MHNRSHKMGGCCGINPYLLYSSFLIFPPQVIDIYNQSAFILGYHVTNFAMINPLVLLKAKYSKLIKFYTLHNLTFSGIVNCQSIKSSKIEKEKSAIMVIQT